MTFWTRDPCHWHILHKCQNWSYISAKLWHVEQATPRQDSSTEASRRQRKLGIPSCRRLDGRRMDKSVHFVFYIFRARCCFVNLTFLSTSSFIHEYFFAKLDEIIIYYHLISWNFITFCELSLDFVWQQKATKRFCWIQLNWLYNFMKYFLNFDLWYKEGFSSIN
jgi:hypothetical protein